MFLQATNKDFDSMAEQVSDKFFNEQVPLTQAVVKIASEFTLNPMEVKSLLEKANTEAALQMLSSGSDKKAEFDLADYEDVMAQIYANSAVTNTTQEVEVCKKEASTDKDRTTSFPDLRTASRVKDIVFKTLEKTAGRDEVPLEVQIFKQKRTVEEYRQHKVACELRIHKDIATLIHDFDRMYGPDLCKFANEAYSLHGEKAVPMLTAITDALGEPSEFSKVAAVVDDREENHKLFTSALKELTKLATITSSLEAAVERLDSLWAEVPTHGIN